MSSSQFEQSQFDIHPNEPALVSEESALSSSGFTAAMFERVEIGSDKEPVRKSLTYWQDAWRRLKKHKPAIAGLIGVVAIVCFAIFGPIFSSVTYYEQNVDLANIPPRLSLYQLEEDFYIFLTNDYKLIQVSRQGDIIGRIPRTEQDQINRVYTYTHEETNHDIALDFSNRLLRDREEIPYEIKFDYRGQEYTEVSRVVSNRTFPFGTDILGRSLLVRVMDGARISLTVAFVTALVNLFIGVLYGSIAAYEGGRVDIIMMRIVDILNAIPLVLLVIVIMVVIGNRGLLTMIVTLSAVYWVLMARLVRGQILSLKEQEFVYAAQALGVSKFHIISKHLIPNAIGPIIVSMTLMIPTAIFVESFISFIGLGVSAPSASWGTLANDALGSLLSYPYQLLYPIFAIAITILSFNLLGDGLRDALDPRLRKG